MTARPSCTAVNLRGLRALVADDNDTGRLILREMLAGWGALVEEIDDRDEVVGRLEAGAFDVLLLACKSCARRRASVVRSIRARGRRRSW